MVKGFVDENSLVYFSSHVQWYSFEFSEGFGSTTVFGLTQQGPSRVILIPLKVVASIHYAAIVANIPIIIVGDDKGVC